MKTGLTKKLDRIQKALVKRHGKPEMRFITRWGGDWQDDDDEREVDPRPGGIVFVTEWGSTQLEEENDD